MGSVSWDLFDQLACLESSVFVFVCRYPPCPFYSCWILLCSGFAAAFDRVREMTSWVELVWIYSIQIYFLTRESFCSESSKTLVFILWSILCARGLRWCFEVALNRSIEK